MALYFPDILVHGNPDLPILDSDFLKGGTRSPVQSLTDLYALLPKVEQLKERATRVYVSGENKYYVLVDITKVDSSEGWAEDNSGGGSTTVENVVYTTGDQSVSGVKTFVDGINVGNPSSSVNTLYVRSGEVGINNDDPQAALDVSGLALFSERPQVNGTGVLLSGDIDTANLVYTTGNQIISGIKTFAESGVFSSGIIVSGNAWFDTRPTVNGTGVMLQGEAAAGAGQLFTGDIKVSIPNGTSFGKYLDGATIPASGKSANDVILMACFNAKEPTLTFTPDTIPFGFEGPKTLSSTFGYTVNSLDALPSLVKIDKAKAGITNPVSTNDSDWDNLTSQDSGFTDKNGSVVQSDAITHTRFDRTPIKYRFTVHDNLGGKKTQVFELIPDAYSAPTISNTVISEGLTRYRGDADSTYAPASGSNITITKNSNYVKLKSYRFEKKIDNNSWATVGSSIAISDNNLGTAFAQSFGSISYSAVAGDRNANTLSFRIVVIDEFNEYNLNLATPPSTNLQTNLGEKAVNFYYKCGTIYSSKTSLAITDIDDAAVSATNTSPGVILQDPRVRNFLYPVKPGVGNYLYYVYKASGYNSASARLQVAEGNPALTLLGGSFAGGVNNPNEPQLLNNVTNKHGATVSYVVHRSSSVNSYGNVPGTPGTTLTFS
jgi:hypothetical protein